MKLLKSLLNGAKQAAATINQPTTQEMIEQIHHEFETAGEKLLSQANEWLANNSQLSNVEKVKELERLGFLSTQEYKAHKKQISDIKMNKEIADLVEKYSLRYPNHKYITEEQVNLICEKYNLVCGGVSLYKGFVPEKNLKQIAGFKPHDEDYEYLRCNGFYGTVYKTTFKEWEEYSIQKEIDNKLRREDPLHYHLTRGVYDSIEYQKRMPELLICAPIKDMDMKGRELRGSFIREIPDPVVLYPLEKGYIILTAWGDEASDPIVVNQKLN